MYVCISHLGTLQFYNCFPFKGVDGSIWEDIRIVHKTWVTHMEGRLIFQMEWGG